MPKKIYPEGTKPNKNPLVKEVWESKLKQKPSNNKHISYSQLSSFANCQRQWYLQYVKKLAPYQPSIHAAFGTAMHETIQSWLEVLYHEKVKTSNEMDLNNLLYENLIKSYKMNKALNGHEHFSTADELNSFWLDGKHILDFLKKKRGGYFSTKHDKLAGVETLLYQELRPGVMFKGFIDLVFYNELSEEWTIVDIKTSTSGWNDFAKKDDKKIAQILLYKEFFSKQFNIPIDKINVEYFILKRRVPKDAEFAAMQKRVQEFRPPSGKIKRGQAVSLMNNFVETAIDKNGEYIDKEYPTSPSKWGCNFCAFKEMRICPDAVLG
jgi:CRISPR/Cas system-associated exonuclease Cas4 (RecB family)